MSVIAPMQRLVPLTVGEVAARSGVAVSAIHFYEAKGLIRSQRSPGNQRRYPRAVLRRVAIIKAAQKLGIPLASIREALSALPQDTMPSTADWARMSAIWRAELDARINSLIRLRDHLDDCIGCGCLSISSCPLRNPYDMLSEKGPGPHLLETENLSSGDEPNPSPKTPPRRKKS